MKSETATYILRNDKNEIIAEFESSIPVKYLQKFLSENFNKWNKEKFIAFVESFKTVSNKFSLML